VLSAGIGGGYPAVVALGGTVLGTTCTAADLGADSPDGFLTLDELGFGSASTPVDEQLLHALALAIPDAYAGPVLTVNTVTGTADGAAALLARYPDAVAEAMEGYGVGVAAAQFGLPFAELRTISNPVGPRDRGSWRLDLAFGALAEAGAALAGALATGSLKAWP
jgi:futalosine hydrolase